MRACNRNSNSVLRHWHLTNLLDNIINSLSYGYLTSFLNNVNDNIMHGTKLIEIISYLVIDELKEIFHCLRFLIR